MRGYRIDPTGNKFERVATQQWQRSYARVIVPISGIVVAFGIVAAIIVYLRHVG